MEEETASYGLEGEDTRQLTALQHFAEWLKDIPKDTVVEVTKSKKTIVFIRQDIK